MESSPRIAPVVSVSKPSRKDWLSGVFSLCCCVSFSASISSLMLFGIVLIVECAADPEFVLVNGGLLFFVMLRL